MTVKPARPGLAALALALASFVPAAAAADLLQAWQGALAHDKAHAIDGAEHVASQARRAQAAALWKPQVGLSAGAGLATHETDTEGAQFSAPGLGQSAGVGFATSVTQGASVHWSIDASMPLYNPERRARQQQLILSADAADLAWQAATQSLMLRTAERYFDVALAEETVQVLRRQVQAVQRAAAEARDRFRLGAVPVTDTHEAHARLASLQAQLLAAESDLLNKQAVLADSTGLPAEGLQTQLPVGPYGTSEPAPLERWLEDARSGNPALRGLRLALEVARQEAVRHGRAASASVDLVAQVGRDHLAGSGDFGSASSSATTRRVGIQLVLPLYTGGYRSARQDEAWKRVDKATAEIEQGAQQVALQVRNAWRGLRVGQQRQQALEEGLLATLSRTDATRTGRDVGQRTTLDLLNAENDAAAARLSLAQARVALQLDRLRLSALAGRLDEATLRAANAELAPLQP